MNVGSVHRVPVRPGPSAVDLEGHDYADAFEVRLSVADARTAEEWVRCGLEEAPAVVRLLIRTVHRHVLRFELGPAGAAEHILGWRVVRNEPDVLRMEAEGALGRAVILALRLDSRRVSLETFVFYRRRGARQVWAVVGPVHRRIAPLLLRRAARGGAQPSFSGRTSG